MLFLGAPAEINVGSLEQTQFSLSVSSRDNFYLTHWFKLYEGLKLCIIKILVLFDLQLSVSLSAVFVVFVPFGEF